MPDSALGRLIRERLALGLLPRVGVAKCWASKGGIEVPCDACAEPITPADVLMDLELDHTYHFHGECFRIYAVVQSAN